MPAAPAAPAYPAVPDSSPLPLRRRAPSQEASKDHGPGEPGPARPAPVSDTPPAAGGAVREAGRGLTGRVGLGVLYRMGVSAAVLHPEWAVLPGHPEWAVFPGLSESPT